MDLELLRTFLEVNRTRHFGKAAQALHLTQAAVSARIKQLENTLGVRLFDRLRRDIRLTPEGNRLLRHADLLISEWRKTRQEVAPGGARQQLSVGGTLRLWDVVIQDWFHRLRRQQPQLAIIAESLPAELLTRRLLDGVLDLAFMVEPPNLEVLQISAIGMIELLLVGSRPIAGADAALADEYLMVDWGVAHALQHRRLFPDAPEPRVRVAHSKMALAHLLELGGFAYLPLPLVAGHLHSGRLHRVPDAPTIDRPVSAIYPLRGAKTGLINTCLGLFRINESFTLSGTGNTGQVTR
jgi:DNA-binding transcriptional LysR family regulator